MPFTNNPIVQTYSSHDIGISTDILLRPDSLAQGSDFNLTQDAGLVNLFPIKEGGEEVAITRPGIFSYSGVGTPPVGNMRGFYIWETGATAGAAMNIYIAIDDKVYWNSAGTWVAQFTWTAVGPSTPVRFCEFIDDTNHKKLIVVDGVEGYVFDHTAGTVTKITDVNFPSPHIPFPVFLDGRIFIAKSNTGDVYNCALNDPLTWPAGSFLSAEMYPDNIQALVRVDNHIVVIGFNSTEYFYDAGYSDGTPLARVEGAALPIGTLSPNSIATNKGSITLLANNNDGQATVTVIENQRYTDIGGNFMIPLLSAKSASSYTSDGDVRGYFFRHRSELYYVLNFGNGYLNSSSNLVPTFAYSFSNKKWTELRFGANGASEFPVFYSQGSRAMGQDTWVGGHAPNSSGTNVPFLALLQDKVSLTGRAQDNITGTAVDIYQEFRTTNQDFGTMERKFMYRAGVLVETGNSQMNTADPNSLLFEWSDDDYRTWTAVNLNLIVEDMTGLTPLDVYFPFVTQLGNFRRRAFRGIYTGKPMRWRKIVVDINKGQR